MAGVEPTVFVVDDDISVRESLKLLIESAGWLRKYSGPDINFWRVRAC